MLLQVNTQNYAASNNNSAATQLFDLVQRKADGAWLVWTRKSLLDLNDVSRDAIESARGGAFTQAEWEDYIRQPHITEPTVWVVAGIYQSRPTVETVLALLGVKRKPKPATPTARPSRPKVANA